MIVYYQENMESFWILSYRARTDCGWLIIMRVRNVHRTWCVPKRVIMGRQLLFMLIQHLLRPKALPRSGDVFPTDTSDLS